MAIGTIPSVSMLRTANMLTLASFGPIDWTVLGGYLLLLVVIGAIVARRQRNAEEFFLGGRSMPSWAVSLSILATSLSAATFIGVPQISYGGDLSYLILTPGGIIGVIIIAWLFVPAFFRAGTLTIYGFLDRRFGTSSRIAVSIMFLFGRLLASGSRLFIAAIPVTLILFGTDRMDLPHFAGAIVVLGLVGTLYTALGGIRAVIWTDVLQIIVVVLVAGATILILLRAIPLGSADLIELWRTAGENGSSKLRVASSSPSLAASFTIWTGFFAVVFNNVASYGVDHDLAQRMMTCRSAWRGGWSLIVSNLVGVPVVLLFLVIGLLLYVYYGRPDVMGVAAPTDLLESDFKVFPQFMVHHLPAGLAGLGMAGLLAAAMSSFDSAVNAMAACLLSDVVWPLRRQSADEGARSARMPRLVVVGIGVVLTAVACGLAATYDPEQSTLIDFALGIMAFAYAGMLGVFLTALLTNRGNAVSVLAALASGVVVVWLLQPSIAEQWLTWLLGDEPLTGPIGGRLLGEDRKIAWPWWMVVGTTVSFVVCVLGKERQTA
jgi:SSS family solute:Na+ symporter